MGEDKEIRSKPVRVLQFTTQLNPGGVQTFLFNYHEHMDSNEVIFDYVVQTNNLCALDSRVTQRGSKIYHVTSMTKSLYGYMRDVYRLLKKHPEYQIIHTHLNYRNMFPLICGKLAKVKVRISHSHSNYTATSMLKSIERRIFRTFLPIIATDYWACSDVAGEWLYGRNQKYKVIHNAIEVSKYRYSDEIRANLRRKHHIGDQEVWINVGMFGKAKNHKFLLGLFQEHVKKNPNTVLVLCGDGSEKRTIEQMVENYGLREKVLFLGTVNNVNEYLMMADIMITPSLYEGLALVCVEAQATGCPIVASSAVPEEALFAENTERCLSWETSDWEESMNRVKNTKIDRSQAYMLCAENNFEIYSEARKLQNIYIDM